MEKGNALVIKERLGVIVDALDEAQHLVMLAEIRVQAKGFVEQLQSCQFVANLCHFCRILSRHVWSEYRSAVTDN